jgi:predicted nucleotidyltransferase
VTADLTSAMDVNIKVFLDRVVYWAKNEPDLLALALVGSHARGQATPDSDVDLILLFDHPEAYLTHQGWISEFGEPIRVAIEDWGKVTALRAFYADGMEVEYGLSDLDWGADPSDEGDARVIRDGLVVLFERGGHLSDKLKRFLASSEADLSISTE